MKFYSIEPVTGEDARVLYEHKCPPNSSVHESWTTRGVAAGEAEITFVEYEYYDKDPDGVREAYGCLYDSEHTLTADTGKADPEKLFVYTVQKDGKILRGFDFTVEDARAIYVLSARRELDGGTLLRLTDTLCTEKRSYAEEEALILAELLQGVPSATLAVFP